MAITVYSPLDASAPTIGDTAGMGITFFDAILVNGYGSKPSQGWTKAFSGTNKAAYLHPSGEFYLRVDHSATSPIVLRCYETMTDVDTGADPFPTVAQKSDSVSNIPLYVLSQDYRLYGNGEFMYFVCTQNAAPGVSTTQVNVFFCGRTLEDLYSNLCSSANRYTYAMRNYDGSVKSQICGSADEHIKADNGGYSGRNDFNAYPGNPEGKIILKPAHVRASGPTRLFYRGFYPGLYIIETDVSATTGVDNIIGENIVTDDKGNTYHLINYFSGNYTDAIKISGSW